MRLITLEAWAFRNFEPAPSMNTVRKWARDGLLMPPPVKHGRSYYIDPDARYVPQKRCRVPRGDLVDRIRIARANADITKKS
ncbi:MAG: excisionase [Pseudomonas sp.]|uniref:excisionase n=1 Tax=Pseudomonas sp. TaxID=306 RepID=UPI0027268F3C|nr:excisionase [Pseudomonas sp.]MDO9328150.1 excisionase [Pseudomonas sp.]